MKRQTYQGFQLLWMWKDANGQKRKEVLALLEHNVKMKQFGLTKISASPASMGLILSLLQDSSLQNDKKTFDKIITILEREN